MEKIAWIFIVFGCIWAILLTVIPIDNKAYVKDRKDMAMSVIIFGLVLLIMSML